jgi:predicted transposase/invertase (TIGR01784 family)
MFSWVTDMKNKLVRFDWAIKKLLRNKANFEILEGLLSELLFQDITIREILESEGNKDSSDDKYNRVDLLVNYNDDLVVIEVQVTNQYQYFHRMLYGASKLITDYMESGDGYEKVKKVISVNIVYFDIGQGLDYVYHGSNTFIGMHKHDSLGLSQNQQEMFNRSEVSEIFPEYYILKVNNFDDIAKDTLDEWIYFLKNSEIKKGFKAKGLKKAAEKLDVMKLSDEKRKEYEHFINNRRAEESLVWNSRIEGEFKGKIEGKIEVARRMKQKGLSDDVISEMTGLSCSDIKGLQD